MSDTFWVTSNKHLFKTNKMFAFVKVRVHYLQKLKVIFYMHGRPLMPLTLFYETQFESISSDLTKLNKILIAAQCTSLWCLTKTALLKDTYRSHVGTFPIL